MPTNHPLIESFSGEPLLIAPEKSDLVGSTLHHLTTDPEASKLLNESATVYAGSDDFWRADEHPFRPYTVHNGVLQIPVQGTLINRFSYQFGRWATGYKYIEMALARGLADPNVKAIALVCDSPGGEVAGCFELADKIYDARQVKPVRAFASNMAASAAYALASSAEQVVVARSGFTGSIGVVTMHADFSEALERMGVKVTFIYAGKHKVDGNPYQKLPDDVKERIQGRIDRVYGEFTGMVARNRDMEDSDVRATEALTFDAEDSTEKGLADKVGALEEEMVIFVQEVAEAEDEQMAITQEQLDTAVAQARAEGVTEGKKDGLKEGAVAERERVAAILGSDEAKTRPAAASMMVELGVDAEQAKAQMAKLPEEAKPEAAEAPKTDDKAKGKSAFEIAMENSGNPEVGAEGPKADDGEKADVVDTIFGSIGMAKKTA